jgi:hypothetical protein
VIYSHPLGSSQCIPVLYDHLPERTFPIRLGLDGFSWERYYILGACECTELRTDQYHRALGCVTGFRNGHFTFLHWEGYENGQGQTEAAVRRCHLIYCSWCLPHPLTHRLCRKILQRFSPSHFYDDLLLPRGLIRERQSRCPIVSVELFHHTFTSTATVLMSEKIYSLSFSVLWLCLFQQIQSVQLFPLLCVVLIGCHGLWASFQPWKSGLTEYQTTVHPLRPISC